MVKCMQDLSKKQCSTCNICCIGTDGYANHFITSVSGLAVGKAWPFDPERPRFCVIRISYTHTVMGGRSTHTLENMRRTQPIPKTKLKKIISDTVVKATLKI